jgi:toxin ParE1/3/4
MAKFKLTEKAIGDLSKIWDYTFEVWSERQADKYYETIISVCQEIANNEHKGKDYECIKENLFGVKSNRHIIFYRIIADNYIEVARILHERMDFKKLN